MCLVLVPHCRYNLVYSSQQLADKLEADATTCANDEPCRSHLEGVVDDVCIEMQIINALVAYK